MHTIMTIGRILLILFIGFFLSLLALFSIPFDKKGGTYFWAGSRWSMFSMFVCRVKVKLEGKENTPPGGNYIVVSNHASMFDIPAMMSVFPTMRIMFKKELSYVPLWGWALRWGKHIMVDRGRSIEAMKSIDRAADAIRSGGSVLLFAEGTRTRDGNLLPFKRGAFSLAAKSGVPILPITINGSFRILPKKSLNIRPSTIHMIIGKPIPTAGIDSREKEIALMNEVRGIIEKIYSQS
jgi:1-acyl-sn-glycerol-3-phosphate acyltransferase